jgi:hypothetical protein
VTGAAGIRARAAEPVPPHGVAAPVKAAERLLEAVADRAGAGAVVGVPAGLEAVQDAFGAFRDDRATEQLLSDVDETRVVADQSLGNPESVTPRLKDVPDGHAEAACTGNGQCLRFASVTDSETTRAPFLWRGAWPPPAGSDWRDRSGKADDGHPDLPSGGCAELPGGASAITWRDCRSTVEARP